MITAQTRVQSEMLLLDILGQCASLSLRVRKLVEAGNFPHHAAGNLETQLLSLGRVARDIDVDLFGGAPISCSLH